jgi:cysteine desulfurase
MQTIYLDHSTTTPLAASVREAMLPFLQNMYGHPSSNHWMGRAAAEAIEDARSNLASLLDCHPTEILFTSGGTESINLALLGTGRAIRGLIDKPHCITSNLEHAAVRLSLAQLEREGWDVSVVACDRTGRISANEVHKAIRPETRLISITHASYELGTIQPLTEIAELCRDRELYFHTDAAQSVGKIECLPTQLGVDLLSLSGHKFFGPKGVGALYVRLGVPLDPILFGEGCEAGLRPGTASVANIAGLGQAAKLAQAGLASSIDRVNDLRNRFHANLQRLIGQPITIHGQASNRLPGTLTIELPGISAEELQQRLPEICFGPTTLRQNSTKSFSPSIWQSLGLDAIQLTGTLRISIGWSTSEDELLQAAQMIASAFESLVQT